MIKHIVQWRLDDRDKAADYITESRKIVERMRNEIDGLRYLELGVDRSATEFSSDLVLYSELDSWDALAGYDAHPAHQEFRAFLKPHVTERLVNDYQSD